MPESKEASGKAADIYVGVVDLFSIILPGALLALVLWAVFQGSHTTLFDGGELPKFVPEWLLFLICAYVLGHFVSALGSWIMDYLYDGYYKHKFEFQKKRDIPSLRRRADRLIMKALGPELYKEGDNRLTWGESFLILSNSAGAAKLDKQEADSKFFRSLAAVSILSELVCFSPLTLWAPLHDYLHRAPFGIAALALIVYLSHRKPTRQLDLNERVKQLLGSQSGPATTAAQPANRLDWPDEQWLKVEREVREQDIRKNRIFSFILPFAWLGYVAMMASITNDKRGWVVGIVCWALTVMSARRFMDLRAKRLAQGYYLTIALSKTRSYGGPASDSTS
jgi:fatty acid desaturase